MRSILAALAVVLFTPGCSNKPPSTSAPAGESKTIKAAMVTDMGGIDDQSFNAAAWAGLQKAKAEHKVEGRFLESREQADYVTNLSSLAQQGNDIVFAVGFLMEDALKQVAPASPSTKFAIIDGSAPEQPNCVSLKFREEEGCFLAGYLAGSMTKTGALGFVGGMESPLITKFEVGYIAGARTARPDIRVVVKYVGSWDDNAKGREAAEAAFRDGADIIFHAAGKSGLGVIDAAADRGEGFYAIGVDKDQDSIRPGRVLTSMMKDVESAVYQTVTDLVNGNWTPGTKVFGIKEGGIRLSDMKHTKDKVPAEVLTRIDDLSKQIAEGKLSVPSTQEELQNFQPPKELANRL